MKTPTLPCTIHHFENGGCAATIFGLFVVPAMMAGARSIALALHQSVEPMVTAGACLGALAFLGMTYFFSTDLTAVVDRRGMKITTQRHLGFLRGAVQTLVETRWDRETRIEDVTAVSITSNRGAQKFYRLRIGDAIVPNHLLGAGERDGKYLELIEAIRAAVGDRLVEKTDLGVLEDAVRNVARTELRNP